MVRQDLIQSSAEKPARCRGPEEMGEGAFIPLGPVRGEQAASISTSQAGKGLKPWEAEAVPSGNRSQPGSLTASGCPVDRNPQAPRGRAGLMVETPRCEQQVPLPAFPGPRLPRWGHLGLHLGPWELPWACPVPPLKPLAFPGPVSLPCGLCRVGPAGSPLPELPTSALPPGCAVPAEAADWNSRPARGLLGVGLCSGWGFLTQPLCPWRTPVSSCSSAAGRGAGSGAGSPSRPWADTCPLAGGSAESTTGTSSAVLGAGTPPRASGGCGRGSEPTSLHSAWRS